MYRYVYELLTAEVSQYVGLGAIVAAALAFWRATSPEFKKFLGKRLRWVGQYLLSVLRKKDRPSSGPSPPPDGVNAPWARLGTVCLLVFLVIVVVGNSLKYPGPRNEYLTNRAWSAYEKERWEDAITRAQICIDEYGSKASDDQKLLTDQKAPKPKLRGFGELEKNRIFEQGLINDVAACHYVKGRAFEKLQETDAAIAAYEETVKFTHAAVWDPRGKFFWSPAEDAESRLKALRAKRDHK